MKLLRLLKQITAIITLYTLQTKLRIAPVALVETSLSRLLYSMRGTALTSFSYTKMHGRVVTCRDVTQEVEFWLMPCRIVNVKTDSMSVTTQYKVAIATWIVVLSYNNVTDKRIIIWRAVQNLGIASTIIGNCLKPDYQPKLDSWTAALSDIAFNWWLVISTWRIFLLHWHTIKTNKQTPWHNLHSISRQQDMWEK